MENLVLFGAPGVGKGTHAGILAEKYNLLHLSTGDMLRSEIQSGSPLGERVRAKMEKGDLVGDDVVIALVDKALASTNSGVILDGFPRTVQQAQALDFLFKNHCRRMSCVISIDAPRDELVRRIHERALISGRADDANDDTIRHRLEEYEQKTKPVIDFYKVSGLLVSIDGSGEINQTSMRLCRIVDHIIKHSAK
ncbi:MAG: adenylate kinase [Bacteroidales bacterium]|nr:adenylate kinase [Bacteroidales bacterium]